MSMSSSSRQMSVSSRASHRYSTQQPSSINTSSGRLSATPYSNSPVNTRFSDRRLSVSREQLQLQSNDDMSTEMITIALAKAQNAVLLDQRNNVTAALDGYSQCCAILAEVISKETDSDDITRLRQIHDTYSVRMHVLSTMQLEPNPLMREMPPLPTQAILQEFEDENDVEEDQDEITTQLEQIRISRSRPVPEFRYSEVRPLAVSTHRPSLHRSSSSRDSTGVSRPPLSSRNYTHSRNSSYTRTQNQEGSLSSLEPIPANPTSPLRPSSKGESSALTEMDEEMDDAAFLERITRGFATDDELDDEMERPSTASTINSFNQLQRKKSSDQSSYEMSVTTLRTDIDDFVLPSPRTIPPNQPSISPKPIPKHDRARNTSSPLPQTTTPRPSSARKNLSISGAQPMLKSLSANNAIPNPDEVIVPGNPDAAPAVPPKIKKRPHLIRVVSESTMRSNYSSRLSTFDVSPISPPPTASTSPATSRGTSDTSNKKIITHDREGGALAENSPEDPFHRPYWLMGALALSMRNQKGAYINARLFVPQGVWTLKNVKLKAVEEKINSINMMTVAVRFVLDTDSKNIPGLIQEIANLEGTMDTVQQNILRKIEGKTTGSNSGNGDGKLMTRKMSQSSLLGGWGKRLRSKSTTSSTLPTPSPQSGRDAGLDAVYPNAILALCDCAIALDDKFENIDPEEMPIKIQLRIEASRRRIAEFFANNVCRFVLQDLATLMNKYIKRANEWMIT